MYANNALSSHANFKNGYFFKFLRCLTKKKKHFNQNKLHALIAISAVHTVTVAGIASCTLTGQNVGGGSVSS